MAKKQRPETEAQDSREQAETPGAEQEQQQSAAEAALLEKLEGAEQKAGEYLQMAQRVQCFMDAAAASGKN